MRVGTASSGSAGGVRLTAGSLNHAAAPEDGAAATGGEIMVTSGKATYGDSGSITLRTADGTEDDDSGDRADSGGICITTGSAPGGSGGSTGGGGGY